MPQPQTQQPNPVSVENNFTKGLITEFTGLNFPENAATDTNNCIYTIVGDVIRREGFDYEANGILNPISRGNNAVSTYKWNNVGGDGLTQIVVQQTGNTLYFYRCSSATAAAPLSTTLLNLSSTIIFTPFVAPGINFDPTIECQFADGNGYLFVFHPNCDPFYCSYAAGNITALPIKVTTRDFSGITETGVAVNSRPLTNSNEHLYNLTNQGWVKGSPWQGISLSNIPTTLGSHTFLVGAGMTVNLGDSVVCLNNHAGSPGGVYIGGGSVVMSGTVTAYSGTSLTLNITSVSSAWVGTAWNDWIINPTSTGYITTWNTAVGNYPSNADVWWYFKNASGVFDPATTISNITLNTGSSPQGHFILNAFNQQRSLLSGISGLTDVTTTARPKTGTWFQGRVWYAGVDAQQPATGDASYYTWTENIYFSQIVQSITDFGTCYQNNDPTSQNLFGLLPTDGGVIQIQGCGSIYKLFPLLNALLVFAANGVWYITGSQGVGFSANDYTVIKLSAVKSISSTSFVDINGLPMFWNEEGIYSVEPAKQGTSLLNSPLHVNPLEVNPLTVGTILTFYNNIPLQSKKYAKAAYNPIDYTVQWLYKSNNETSVNDRYTYDSILCLNTFNKAFYPYSFTIGGNNPSINSIVYISSPGGTGAPNSVFKYLVSNSSAMTFGEELDPTFVDWKTSGVSANYLSYFVTGYKLHGFGQRRFQLSYLYMYSRLGQPVSYKIQALWDYATTGNSGRWSAPQLTNINSPNFSSFARRHKLRGRGLVLQIKVSSSDGKPFDIMGWSAFESQNTGV